MLTRRLYDEVEVAGVLEERPGAEGGEREFLVQFKVRGGGWQGGAAVVDACWDRLCGGRPDRLRATAGAGRAGALSWRGSGRARLGGWKRMRGEARVGWR